MQPLERMWARVEIARTDSDTSLFYDLLYFGEMLTKLIVAGLVAAVAEDRERQRYAIEHQLVRANGIGEWVGVLEDLLVGPPSQLSVDAAATHKRELTQRWGPEDSWQRTAVEHLHAVCRCLDDSFDQMPAKVPLQRWFQWFAWLRNRTRGHGAPTGRTCSELAPLLEASLSDISGTLSLLGEPWAVLRRNLNGKYRVVMLAGISAPFEHLKRETHHRFQDGVYISLGSEICVVPFLYTDVDLSEFYIANGNFKPSGFEALSYITDDVRSVDAEPYMLPASALPMSGTAAGPTLDVRGNCFTNVPPPIEGYVSRPELEESLLKLLLDDRHPIITLVGRGGVGKTSLALEVLDRVMQSDDYLAALWFSARDIDLLAQGPKRVQADILTQRDIAQQFVELMNPAGSASKDFDDHAYLGNCMAGRAGDGPLLLVFDNFETIRNPLDVYGFIDTFIRLPNKVLITSRFRDFKGDYPLEVGGMSRNEFEQLALGTAARLGVSGLMSEQFLADLYEESDGHPYVVRILLGEMARRGSLASFERVMATREDILDALFERTFASLSLAEQRVFLTVCNWRSIVPRLAIEAALLRPANEERMDVDRALVTLEQSSLIEVVASPDPADEFVRVPLAAGIFGRRKLTVSPMKTAIDADTQVIQMFGATQVHEAGKGIAPRVDRVVAVLAEKVQRGEDISADLPVVEFIARRHPPTRLRLADLFEEDADRDLGLRRATDALSRYLETESGDTGAWRRLADVHALLNDRHGELHARLQIAEVPGAALADISHLANRFNSLIAKGEIALPTDERRTIAERIRSLLERRVSEADATTLSRLAWICLHLGDTSSARKYAMEGLSKEPHNRHCLGLIERLGDG